ncbi:MAG: REP-associated tyrosine transposase [Calditrichota bacterium]
MLQRHSRIAFKDSIHFVTTVTNVRGDWFIDEVICTEILNYFEEYRNKYEISCHGYVLMPDHFHALLSQRTDESVIPAVMQSFKKITSRQCLPAGYPAKRLWRYRYDDVPVPGRNAALTKLNYLHENPLRKGLCDVVESYPWSSAKDYIRNVKGVIQISPV